MQLHSIKKRLLPTTSLGTVSLYLFLSFLFLLIVGQSIVTFQGPRADNTFFDNSMLSVTMLLSGLCAITAFILGLISIIKKERAILVFIITAIGFLVLLFLIGEFTVPH